MIDKITVMKNKLNLKVKRIADLNFISLRTLKFPELFLNFLFRFHNAVKSLRYIIESMNNEELRNVDLPEVSLLLKKIPSKFVEKEIYKDGNTINALYKGNRILKALGK